MKKYNILLAMIALVLSSLACQTIMGGGNDGGYETPVYDDSAPTSTSGEDSGDVTVGGDSDFPIPSDASNVISTTTPQTVTFQTNLSAEEIMKFYQDEFSKQGFTEDTALTANFNGIIAMSFNGDGKTIVIGGVPNGDGSTTVSIAYQ